jgi:hypothetical protein
MAGSFGFEKDKYDVSMAIGELELLPAVRQSPLESLIIADGFSCREQIAQGTGRHALHLAEVMALALKRSPIGEAYPEKEIVKTRQAGIGRSMKRAALAVAGIAAGAALLRSLKECRRERPAHARV